MLDVTRRATDGHPSPSLSGRPHLSFEIQLKNTLLRRASCRLWVGQQAAFFVFQRRAKHATMWRPMRRNMKETRSPEPQLNTHGLLKTSFLPPGYSIYVTRFAKTAMPNDEPKGWLGGGIAPLLLAAGAGADGVWLIQRRRPGRGIAPFLLLAAGVGAYGLRRWWRRCVCMCPSRAGVDCASPQNLFLRHNQA